MNRMKSVARWTVSALVCSAALVTARGVQAQTGKVVGALDWFFNIPRWSVDVHGGFGNYGRFLLQAPFGFEEDVIFRERELRGLDAWTLGLGVGATPLPRTGFRLGVNYTSSDLNWRDDSGIDTDLLDSDNLANLTHWMVGAEIIRYLLPETSRFTPYGSAGVAATWWSLDDTGLSILGEDTHFRWAALGSVGLQFRLSRAWRARAEVAGASVGNPFSGKYSYRAIDGFTIDEPGRVRKTDIRLALAYTWGNPRPWETTDDDDNGGRRRRR